MYGSAQELLDAIEGHYGEQEQQEALDFAEEVGLLDQWSAEAEAARAGDYEQALEQEFQRVEAQVGRKLTPDEEQFMLDNISTQERDEMVVPDFVAEYGEPLAGASTTEEGRVHLGAAAAERVFNEQAEQDHRRQLAHQAAPQSEPDYGEEYE